MMGYLAPWGEFFCCEYYGHIELAGDICSRKYPEEGVSGLSAENFLLSNGWIAFRARDVYTNLDTVITEEQLSFIDNNLEKIVVNEEVRESLSTLLVLCRKDNRKSKEGDVIK